jgi:hypothetical protein
VAVQETSLPPELSMRNTHPSRWSLPPVWPMLVGASSPPRIPDARRVEENPNGYAGKRSHPDLLPIYTNRTRT